MGEGWGEGAFGIFTGREMRPVPDRIVQLPEPFEGRVFDDGFVQRGHHTLGLVSGNLCRGPKFSQCLTLVVDIDHARH